MREFLRKHKEEEHPMISWDIRHIVSWNKGKKVKKKEKNRVEGGPSALILTSTITRAEHMHVQKLQTKYSYIKRLNNCK